tara:strand:- start:290 stop:1363 length:1074 start_codon:yes stop_codon:yes gene_type:complete
MVGANLLNIAGKKISETIGKTSCWVVTDENVSKHYLTPLMHSLKKSELRASAIILLPGEENKRIETVQQIVDKVLGEAPDRDSTLIALGGGVVGDITGFAASIILRGINFVQIPTTLLSQVDSSVGGKTGVNTTQGKNLLGTFYQPKLVLADITVLETLPLRDRISGYAEIVKYGLIRDKNFYLWLEENGKKIISLDSAACQEAVKKSCLIKGEVVAADEKEEGHRALLNFGHTFGHALEKETGFNTSLLHGEAVSLGMIMAITLSIKLGVCSQSVLDRVQKHFQKIGLPTKPSKNGGDFWNPEILINNMTFDKKRRKGRIAFILLNEIGDAFISNDVNLLDVKQLLENLINNPHAN